MAAVEFIEAMTSDCRVLLARFEEKQSVRFEAFCEVWKELKFSLIHHAGDHEWQKIQVVDSLYRILSHYLMSSCPLQYQVGAIYALYSVYHTQHVTPKVKIRMTMSMWNDLMKLQENVREQKHYDVYYVISSLRADKAFLFVAMPVQLACGSRDAISQYEREVAKESKSSNTVETAQEIIQKVSEIDVLYNSAKTRICSPDEGELLVDPVTLKVTSTDLVTNLQKDVTDFETWSKTNKDSLKARHVQHPPELGLPQDRKNDSDKEKEVTSEPAQRAQLVSEIKERSFRSLTKVSKSKRYHRPIPESPKSDRKLRKRTNKTM